MVLPPHQRRLLKLSTKSKLSLTHERIEILAAFADLPDARRAEGQRHSMALCLALFTLAIVAGNRGFLAIGDWLRSYRQELIHLFKPPLDRLPSYSTIRRVLLNVDYQSYSGCLAKFFGIQPLPGETLAVDGKVLRGSYSEFQVDGVQ